MRWNRLILSVFPVVAIAGCTGSGGESGGVPETTNRAVSDRPVYKTWDEHEWRPLDPNNPDGTKIATLWGDPTMGAYGALLRFPAGFKSPRHSHSADERTVTIQGTAIHWTESESDAAAKRMVPGSYTLIRGNVNHVSSCAAGGQECIAFLSQAEPFDFKVAASPTAGTAARPAATHAAAHPSSDQADGRAQIEANLQRFDTLDFEGYSKQDWALFRKLHCGDVAVHWPDGHVTRGVDRHVEDIKQLFVATPDSRISAHPIKFGSNEWTAVTGVLEGTFTRPIPQAGGGKSQPTGKKAKLPMATLAKWRGACIVEGHLFWDNAEYGRQLGLRP